MTPILSLPLLRRTWRAQRGRVGIVAVALVVWSFIMPVIFATFGRQLAVLLDTDIIPKPFLRLLGADPFSLNGAVALGWVHPIGLGLQVLFPIGLGALAIAGERQRGDAGGAPVEAAVTAGAVCDRPRRAARASR